MNEFYQSNAGQYRHGTHLLRDFKRKRRASIFEKGLAARTFSRRINFLKAAEQILCSAAFNFTYAVNYFRCLKIAKEQFFWNPVIGENI